MTGLSLTAGLSSTTGLGSGVSGLWSGASGLQTGSGAANPLIPLADINLASSPASIVEIDVTGMSTFQIIVDRVVHTAAVQRCMQFSTNGGSSWFTSNGSYARTSSDGVLTNSSAIAFHFTGATAARSGNITVWQPGSDLQTQVYSQATSELIQFLASTSAINRVRVFGGSSSSGTPDAGTMTAGTIEAWGQR